ncbi:hypothetical protein ACFVVX_23940 [Kitasatospora sp. NPDC058170]|uniref:hypothetical protein n=1 Tax=Kitasatospora sp. NPDC058170 TaxID=3346364 RepID=UPI0036D786E5
MTQPRHIGYSDELLADGTVHRRYEDGRSEWRRRVAGGLVHWHDNREGVGTDERLGTDLIKRTNADGTVAYGRDIGYGRTVWARGEQVTVNRTAFRGRLGVVLGALGVAGATAVAVSQFPPLDLSADEEEELRRQAQAQQANSSGGDGGSGSSGGGDGGDFSDDDGDGDYAGDWDDSGDSGWDGDDFG